MKVVKVSENEIKVIRTETITNGKTFTYEYLVSQKKAIQDQKVRDNKQRDKELAEIDELLAECKRLGVREKSS